MMNMLATVSASDNNYQLFMIVCIIMLIVMAVCALISILVIMLQPGNSTGIDAIGGSSETFFGKNKSKTIESKLKKLTVVSLVVLGVCSFVFYLLFLITSNWF